MINTVTLFYDSNIDISSPLLLLILELWRTLKSAQEQLLKLQRGQLSNEQLKDLLLVLSG